MGGGKYGMLEDGCFYVTHKDQVKGVRLVLVEFFTAKPLTWSPLGEE